MVANRYAEVVDHPAHGPVRTFAPPVRMQPARVGRPGPSPALGADTEAVLRAAGYGDDELGALLAAGVVGPAAGRKTAPGTG